MYRKQVRRRRGVLVLLVVVCLALISTAISEADDGPLHSIQSGVSSIFAPVQEGADRALKPFRDLGNWFDETFEARGQNEDLRGEVASLRQELVDTQRAARKAGYAKAVDKLLEDDALAGFDPVESSVIGRSSSVWFSSLDIDEGSNAGIKENDAVITDDGLVGRVSMVSGNNATVALITDGRSAVAARVSGDKGPDGLIEPKVGAPGEMLFGLIESQKEVKNKAKIVTAGFSDTDLGLDSLFPANIPIGEISASTSPSEEAQQTYQVKLYADLSDLPEVTVLTGGGS